MGLHGGQHAHLVQLTVRYIGECNDNYKHNLGYDYDDPHTDKTTYK